MARLARLEALLASQAQALESAEKQVVKLRVRARLEKHDLQPQLRLVSHLPILLEVCFVRTNPFTYNNEGNHPP